MPTTTSLASAPAASVAAAPAPTACLNCATPLHDKFCPHCGQPAGTHQRITLAHWLHDIPHSVWHIDHGILYTLQEMLRRPGPTLRRYLAGQRAPFFRPLSYLLIITGLITLCYAVLHLRPYNVQNPNVPPELRLVQERFVAFFSKYINWFTVALLPLIAGILRLVLRRTKLYYAEFLVVATLVVGTTHAITLAALPFAYLMNGTSQAQLLMGAVVVLNIVYQAWAYAGLLKSTSLSRAGRYLRGGLAASITYFFTLTLALTILISTNWQPLKQYMQRKAALAAQHRR